MSNMLFQLANVIDEQNIAYNAMDVEELGENDVSLQKSMDIDDAESLEIDLSYSDLDTFPANYTSSSSTYQPSWIRNLSLHHNKFEQLPCALSLFTQLTALDISNNKFTVLPSSLTCLINLRVLIVKNNQLDQFSFPSNFGCISKLEILNLSGNRVEEMPLSITRLPSLKELYLGGNQLKNVPNQIGNLITLEMLYLGGNQLCEIPQSIGKLKNLKSLALCENRLETIPSTVGNLKRLENLNLHSNQLRTLPSEIVTLQNLQELIIHSNPLLIKSVPDTLFEAASLMELAGRSVKCSKIAYNENEVPMSLVEFLDSANQCAQPKCNGVYFEAKVKHVEFVDFCGECRVPVLQNLCSSRCCMSVSG